MYTYAKNSIPEFVNISSVTSAKRSRYDDISNARDGESHDFWEFVYLEQGTFNILVDGEVFHLNPGQLVIYPPHSFHCVAASHGAILNVVCFSSDSEIMRSFPDKVINISDALREELSHLIAFGKRIFTNAPQNIFDRGMLLRDGVSPNKLCKFGNLLENFLIDLYEELCVEGADKGVNTVNSENYHSEQLLKITGYMKENISKNLSLEEISTACRISIPNLHRLCKAQCGCGPITYFISLKIGAAKRMMDKTSMNFTQISEALGFSSVHYFSKLFKIKTGMSPSEYAKSFHK